METEGLLQTVRQLSPALLCVSVTVVSSLEAVVELGRKTQELPPSRPVLIFGGQVFEQRADLIAWVPGSMSMETCGHHHPAQTHGLATIRGYSVGRFRAASLGGFPFPGERDSFTVQ